MNGLTEDINPTVFEVGLKGEEFQALAGQQDAYLRLIESELEVRLQPCDGILQVHGSHHQARAAVLVLESMQAKLQRGRDLTDADIRYALRAVQRRAEADLAVLTAEAVTLNHRGSPVRPRTAGQARFIEAASQSDLTFCVGPAGTGKTYLAMALAVAALREKSSGRIVLTRPIVEAGERLGYLPGDVMDKVEPYLRPLYDALHDILGPDKLQRHRQRGTIEVVPLAYMRGRTVNDAFIVLDEAQNTTPAQMKMALTRMGLGSQMVVTGDPTQSDLPENQESGLIHALRILAGTRGVAQCFLSEADIVRHGLVQRIVQAYEAALPADTGNQPII